MHRKQPDEFTEQEVPRSDINTVLSSAGNGVTIGGFPLIATSFVEIINPKYEASRNLKLIGVFASVVGCAIGAVVGVREVKEINHYRASLRKELKELRDQTNENARKIEAWTDKEKSRTTQSESTPKR